MSFSILLLPQDIDQPSSQGAFAPLRTLLPTKIDEEENEASDIETAVMPQKTAEQMPYDRVLGAKGIVSRARPMVS